jgi:hypothetical protein
MAAKSTNQALRSFLKAKVNSVSRERIFHNKLFFDLKLAAARAGYHLSVFEPEVDRDAFDVFLDDGDNERRIQVKTVLASSTTATWESTRRFMRPEMLYGDRLGLAPADCGAGGGFLLIEIDDSSPDAPVTYYYTDYFVVTAFEMRLLREKALTPKKGRGRKRESRQETAKKFLHNLAARNASDGIRLPKPLFVRLNSPDSLLALMNLHSAAGCYLPSDKVLEAVERRFQVGPDGDPAQGTDLSAIRVVQSHLEDILALLDEPGLQIFNAPPWPNREG